MNFRWDMGFRSDAVHVARLWADYTAGRRPDLRTDWGEGVLLTHEENARVHRDQGALDDDGPIVQEYLKRQPRGLAVHLYFDTRVGRLVVVVTRDVERVRAELLKQVRHPERLEVRLPK